MDTREEDFVPFEISSRTTLKICKKLNIKNVVGGDFRTLAAELGMSNDDIDIITQRSVDPTRDILRWWSSTSEASVQNLLNVFEKMRRDDLVRILRRDPKVQQALGN